MVDEVVHSLTDLYDYKKNRKFGIVRNRIFRCIRGSSFIGFRRNYMH